MADTGLVDFADAQERAVADSGCRAVAGLAPEGEADLGCLAMFGLIPFGGLGDQLAVPVTAGDLGDDDIGQSARHMKVAEAAVDLSFATQSAQQAV